MTPELAKIWYHDEAAWQVTHARYGYSIAYGTHDEAVGALLDDLLSLHFDGCTEGVPWYEFVRFVPNKVIVRTEDLEGTAVHPKVLYSKNHTSDIHVWLSNLHEIVLDALIDPLVQSLTVMEGDNIRLKNDRTSLQLAMDTAGCWFEGYDPPEGTKSFGLTPKGRDLLEKYGPKGVAQLLVNEDGSFNYNPQPTEEGKA